MHPKIVGKIHRQFVVIPVVLALRDIRVEGRQDLPVLAFHLPICLGVARRIKHLWDA
jgi:hypothetical protein